MDLHITFVLAFGFGYWKEINRNHYKMDDRLLESRDHISRNILFGFILFSWSNNEDININL